MEYFAASLLAIAVASCAPASIAGPETLREFPAPTFLENLAISPGGDILVTNYTGRTIERVNGGGAVFAALDVHPVSILPINDRFLVAAHATPFTEGPSFLGTGVLLFLDAKGAVLRRVSAPGAAFLNGMAFAPDGSVFIADSGKGAILRFDLDTEELTVWRADPLLAPRTEPAFLPGANGLKIDQGALIVSTSAGRALYRMKIDGQGRSAGALEEIAAGLHGADDFAVLPEGGYAISTHGDRIIRVDRDRRVTTITDDPRIRGNTAVALDGAGKSRRLIVLGTGGFSEGLGAPAVVLAVPLPQ